MNLFNKKQLAIAIAVASSAFGIGVVNALPSSATHTHVDPIGIGNCELRTDNWLPPLGMNPGSIPGWIGHPCPQERPNHGGPFPSIQDTSVPGVTSVITPEGQHAAVSPFDNPPGSNFLNSVAHNLIDFNGDEMPNTLSSVLGNSQYLLHDGPVRTKRINKTNPAEDIDSIIDRLEKAATTNGRVKGKDIDFALDILEGNRIRNRAYSGFPLLHYNGPNKLGVVKPIYKRGKKVGGKLTVNMIYFNQKIESDVSLIDVSQVQDVPWTITYNVNILNGGIEDFSPFTMHFDRTPADETGPFHASIDQSFFPMLEEGKRYKIKIKQTLGKYYNLTYTWGWRIHPPRVQVTENANKLAPNGRTLLQMEQDVFGVDPEGSEANKLAAIAKIGDIAPAKRMWNIMRDLRGRSHAGNHNNGHGHQGNTRNFTVDTAELTSIAANLREAYLDWSDRTKLPTGVTADPDTVITLLYANNTIYGSKQGTTGTGASGDDSGQGAAAFKGICNGCAHDWNVRPYNYSVRLFNGDNFVHGYMNVDFGGSRGWENQFQDTDPTTALAEHVHTDPTFIEGRRFNVDDHVLLDNTPNPIKQALRNVPPGTSGGTGVVSVIKGETVEDNLTEVVTNDRIFPMNTGGTEEFLEPTPRELKRNGSIKLNAAQQLGSGCFFTFGRAHAWPNAGGPWGAIPVPPVSATGELGTHRVNIQYNFEPSRRLKIYQFDPLHHDVAVYSLH